MTRFPKKVLQKLLQVIQGSFGIRLALWVSLLAVTPLVLLGTMLALRSRTVMTGEVNGTLVAEAQSFAVSLERSLFEREASLRGWAEDSILLGGLTYGTYDKSNAVLEGYKRRYPMYRGLLLVDPSGAPVAASAPELLRDAVPKQEWLRDRRWFQAAMAGDLAIQLPEGTDALFGGTVLLMAHPLLDREGKLLGVLVGAYDWKDVAAIATPAVERAQARGQRSLRLLIADPRGRVLFDSFGERGRAPPPLEQVVQTGTRNGVGPLDGRVVAWAVNQSELADAADEWLIAASLDEREAYGLISSMTTATVVGCAVLITLSVLLAVYASRRLIEPIRALHRTVSIIVKERDLSQPVPVRSNDEIGELASAFAEMVGRLREMLRRLRQSAFAFASAAQALHAATVEQSRVFTRQATTLEQANVTAKEIKQTSMLATQRAEAMLRVAERADVVGQQGEASLSATVGGLGEIRAQVTAIAEQIGQLSERTRQIGTITRTVKDLADQSNMLALNAAIEAVRSGEHGKGFSVVAREIRSLADQSIRATERVSEILDDTSRAIRAAAQITDRGTERMEMELVQVRRSGDNLRELSSIVQHNGNAVRQIAAAVHQQDEGFAQIFAALADLSMMMEESLQRLATTSEAARLVRTTAEEVSEVSGAYRV